MCEYNTAYALHKTNQRDLAASWIAAAQQTAAADPNFKHTAELNDLYSAISSNVRYLKYYRPYFFRMTVSFACFMIHEMMISFCGEEFYPRISPPIEKEQQGDIYKLGQKLDFCATENEGR